MKKGNVTKKELLAAKKMLNELPAIRGQMRAIEKCNQCGHLFGRNFIPYGLGHGITFDPCLCQLVSSIGSKMVVNALD